MDKMTHCIIRLCLSVGLTVLVTACGSSEENSQVGAVETTTDSTTIAATPEIFTQEQVEQLADLSLKDIEVASDFTFATQRMVTLDLRFSKIQDMAQIAIYSELDQSSQTSGRLLEKGQIQNSARYRGMLSVSTTVDSLIVVANDNFSAAVTVLIDRNDRAHYIFEE